MRSSPLEESKRRDANPDQLAQPLLAFLAGLFLAAFLGAALAVDLAAAFGAAVAGAALAFFLPPKAVSQPDAYLSVEPTRTMVMDVNLSIRPERH